MAIGTYAQLKTAVASWLLRRTDLTAEIPDFIALAEAQIRSDVRCRAMEATASGTLSATTLALPDRFVEARRVVIDGYTQSYRTPDQFYPWREDPRDEYTITGTNFVFQRSTGDYDIQYVAWFAAFSADADTNWLLTNYPDVYLCASLAEAALFIRSDPTAWQAKYRGAVDRLHAAENRAPTTLQVRSDTVEVLS